LNENAEAALLRNFRNPDLRVRTAGEILLAARPGDFFAALLPLLVDPDKKQKANARSLILRNRAAAAPFLVRALGNASPDLRAELLRMLSLMRNVEAKVLKEILVLLLGLEDARERHDVRILIRGSGPLLIPHLLSASGNPDPKVRRHARECLRMHELAPERYSQTLNAEPKASIRREWVQFLRRYGEEADGVLATALKDSDPGVRDLALAHFVQSGRRPELFVPILVDKLEDPRTWMPAAEILRGHRSLARRELQRAAGSPDANLRAGAALVLAELGLPDENGLRTALDVEEREVRLGALRYLARLGPQAEASVPDIRRLLHDRDRRLALQAARTLGCLGAAGRPAVDELLAMLDHSAHTGEPILVVALARISHPPEVLAQLLARSDRRLRDEIWTALAQGHAAAVPELIVILRATRGRPRHEAMRVLGEIGPAAAAALPVLQDIVEDEHYGEAAEKAIALIQARE
jgi:hypothetical protein